MWLLEGRERGKTEVWSEGAGSPTYGLNKAIGGRRNR